MGTEVVDKKQSYSPLGVFDFLLRYGFSLYQLPALLDGGK